VTPVPLAVIAIGGNALSRAGQEGTVGEQFANARTTCRQLVRWVEEGWDLVVTHGNGPQVGNMLWRVELAAQKVHPVDLGICDANSQGQIGYMLQQVLFNELAQQNVYRNVVTLVTQVEVDEDDPRFKSPKKPIGPFFSEEEAREKQERLGWVMQEDSGRGWRRLVPSPEPKRIVEITPIRQVVRAGSIPIACGGGGIPVLRRPGNMFDGVEAVVDKDLTASLLARRLAADVLVICTAVPQVSLDFGTDRARPIHRIQAEDMLEHYQAGQFPPGSMGPKVRACLDFVSGGGVGTRRRAIITDMHTLSQALSGQAGTVISP
jgi:carbamate kinase